VSNRQMNTVVYLGYGCANFTDLGTWVRWNVRPIFKTRDCRRKNLACL